MFRSPLAADAREPTRMRALRELPPAARVAFATCAALRPRLARHGQGGRTFPVSPQKRLLTLRHQASHALALPQGMRRSCCHTPLEY